MQSPQLILNREALRLGAASQLRSQIARGELCRVGTGVYAKASEWMSLSRDERYRTRVRAAALVSPVESLFSHDSAAAMWRLPTIGDWPAAITHTRPWAGGGASRVGIMCRAGEPDPLAVRIGGVLVTSINRTLADVACSSSFVRAVAMLDDGLRMPSADDFRRSLTPPSATKDGIQAILNTRSGMRGVALARKALAFATSQSESPGESFARVQFAALGYPPPELQVAFRDASGVIGIADFYWPSLDFALEFDGRSKYKSGRRFLPDATPLDVLLAEKERERRMRCVVSRFDRIDWAVTSDRRALAERLSRCGLVELRRS